MYSKYELFKEECSLALFLTITVIESPFWGKSLPSGKLDALHCHEYINICSIGWLWWSFIFHMVLFSSCWNKITSDKVIDLLLLYWTLVGQHTSLSKFSALILFCCCFTQRLTLLEVFKFNKSFNFWVTHIHVLSQLVLLRYFFILSVYHS